MAATNSTSSASAMPSSTSSLRSTMRFSPEQGMVKASMALTDAAESGPGSIS